MKFRISIKSNLILIILFVFVFTGCFSSKTLDSSKTNEKAVFKKEPDEKAVFKKEPELVYVNNEPSWIKNKNIKNHITALGVAKNIDDSVVKRAFIVAGNNFLKRVYIKTIYIYKEYLKKLDNPNIFDKDIKKVAEDVSLKSFHLAKTKIKDTWLSQNNELFLHLAVATNIVAEQVQEGSKSLFKVDEQLYENFLSYRAKNKIIKTLEKE